MAETVQQRLRQLREECGISQEKLAAELGVTRMTLAGYELGKRPPDSGFIMRACAYFGCSPDYLLGVSPFKNNEHYQAWIQSSDTLEQALGQLPDTYREDLIAALNWLLQDNQAVNLLTSDKHYMLDRFMNLILSFTNLFRRFTDTVNKFDLHTGIDEAAILQYVETMQEEKQEMYQTIDASVSDLFAFLMRHSKNETRRAGGRG